MDTWRSVKFAWAFASDVPREPGIYALLRVSRVLGLPASVAVICVGQSLDLRRRFSEHVVPWVERNQILARVPRGDPWEFWFRRVSPEELDHMERQLIRELSPVGNVVKYGGVL